MFGIHLPEQSTLEFFVVNVNSLSFHTSHKEKFALHVSSCPLPHAHPLRIPVRRCRALGPPPLPLQVFPSAVVYTAAASHLVTIL